MRDSIHPREDSNLKTERFSKKSLCVPTRQMGYIPPTAPTPHLNRLPHSTLPTNAFRRFLFSLPFFWFAAYTTVIVYFVPTTSLSFVAYVKSHLLPEATLPEPILSMSDDYTHLDSLPDNFIDLQYDLLTTQYLTGLKSLRHFFDATLTSIDADVPEWEAEKVVLNNTLSETLNLSVRIRALERYVGGLCYVLRKCYCDAPQELWVAVRQFEKEHGVDVSAFRKAHDISKAKSTDTPTKDRCHGW
ncbi:uncharacterized protein BO88DRAFT_420258 [Aspergillus vadensis CBS 113365]|uniref:Uncharacterized protein n=1 Tax=Aspergillus vadensis (strain CBS 113365 / IMI 142717 / IBT 24658) TaxID=1448311 RepID=A0A319AVH4_ASPVC|nr:hypothetical protein BO88DRAFT_420258 [Aspergillus vadensis CBS 113365]PYH63574.1 hypothetical protein BO88DRAFT_420258 [Aspergillus vadensis CBS 113365]